MIENNNEDICVFDINVNEVVILSMKCRVWFRYNGIFVKMRKLFSIRDFVIDFFN